MGVNKQKQMKKTKAEKRGWGLQREGADTWDAKADAEALHSAMDGIGTNEKELIRVICDRSRDHLQLVRSEYANLYSRDLIEDVHKETSARMRKLLKARLLPRDEELATLVHDAVKGAGTRMQRLLLVLCPRTGGDIKAMKVAYKRLFDKDMEEDVLGDTSALLKKFLARILTGERSDDEWELDKDLVNADAKVLYEAGEGKVGTDEEEFLNLLAFRSHAHLAAVCTAYADLTGHTFEKGIKKEISGPFRKACLMVVQAIGEFYAEHLEAAFKGAGTNDDAVLEILSVLDVPELQMVNKYFIEKFKVSLHAKIQKEIAGPVKKAYFHLIPASFASVDGE